jgi:pimeloyl-ACP methyl ester carboxylesterase
MRTAASADRTALAFDRYGDGPPVIMTVGAFNTRAATEPLARALAEQFTVLNYDRRGRGDSGDTAPYAVDREIEDLAALIDAADGSASVFGYSSGATLALKAAAAGLPITKLMLYEPPFNPDDSYPLLPADLAGQLTELVAAAGATRWSCTRPTRWASRRTWSRRCATRRSAPAWRRSPTRSPTTRRSSATGRCRPI